MVLILTLIPQYTTENCSTIKSNITCDFWEKMVSQKGMFFNQSLTCMNYNPVFWSNIVLGIKKPQEVLLNLETIEVLQVDETSKVRGFNQKHYLKLRYLFVVFFFRKWKVYGG